MLTTMWNAYKATAYTHNLIVGCPIKGLVYIASLTDTDVTEENLSIWDTSTQKGATKQLRLRVTKKLKALVKEHGAVLCTVQELEADAHTYGINRGEALEKRIFEANNKVWRRDATPYTKAGDIELNGVSYQIKYHRAQIVTMSTLENLGVL